MLYWCPSSPNEVMMNLHLLRQRPADVCMSVLALRCNVDPLQEVLHYVVFLKEKKHNILFFLSLPNR